MKKALTFLSLAGSLLVSAQYESFNFSGPLSSNGWSSHSGTLGQLSTLTSVSDFGNSLHHPGLPTPVGNRAFLTSAQSEDVNFTLPQPITTTAFVSFLLKITDVNSLAANTVATPPGYFLHFSALSGSTLGTTGMVSRLSLRKGSAANTFNIGILNTSGGAASMNDIYGTAAPQDYQVGITYLVVLKYDMTGATGQTSLWINPSLTSEGNPNHSSAFGSSAKLSQVASIALRQANNMGSLEIDEMRLGTSWASVMGGALSTSESSASKDLLISNTLVDHSFKLLSKGRSQIEIYSTTGNLVKNGSYNSNETVDISELSSGIYFLKISNGKNISTVKIVKK
nr:T9SS type A sorting domain-containing protein [uncultured Chryseobacterium sp.]